MKGLTRGPLLLESTQDSEVPQDCLAVEAAEQIRSRGSSRRTIRVTSSSVKGCRKWLRSAVDRINIPSDICCMALRGPLSERALPRILLYQGKVVVQMIGIHRTAHCTLKIKAVVLVIGYTIFSYFRLCFFK